MASTYTANNGIEKPATGDQSGTWGVTVDNNYDLIDQALDGIYAVTLTGLNSYTLAITNGVVSPGRSKTIVFSGTPSGAVTVTITPSNVTKTYWLVNNTSFALTIKNGTGSTATLKALCSAQFYCDGLGNVYPLYTQNAEVSGGLIVDGGSTLTGNVGLGGTLSVAGTSTLTGNTTMSGTASIAGNTTIGGTLSGQVINGTGSNITGTTNLSIVNVSSSLATNTLGVNGAATFAGTTNTQALTSTTHTVTGAATIGTLTATTFGVNGSSTFAGATSTQALSSTSHTITGNLSVGGVLGSGFQSWSPTITGGYTSGTGSYQQLGNLLFVQLQFGYPSTGGTTSNSCTITLPASLSSIGNPMALAANMSDGLGHYIGAAAYAQGTTIYVPSITMTGLGGAGSAYTINISGFIRTA